MSPHYILYPRTCVRVCECVRLAHKHRQVESGAHIVCSGDNAKFMRTHVCVCARTPFTDNTHIKPSIAFNSKRMSTHTQRAWHRPLSVYQCAGQNASHWCIDYYINITYRRDACMGCDCVCVTACSVASRSGIKLLVPIFNFWFRI